MKKLLITSKVIGMTNNDDKRRVYQDIDPNTQGVFPTRPCACPLHQELEQEESDGNK